MTHFRRQRQTNHNRHNIDRLTSICSLLCSFQQSIWLANGLLEGGWRPSDLALTWINSWSRYSHHLVRWPLFACPPTSHPLADQPAHLPRLLPIDEKSGLGSLDMGRGIKQPDAHRPLSCPLICSSTTTLSRPSHLPLLPPTNMSAPTHPHRKMRERGWEGSLDRNCQQITGRAPDRWRDTRKTPDTRKWNIVLKQIIKYTFQQRWKCSKSVNT